MADQFVAAKLAYKEKPTPARKKKYEELKAELFALRNERRGDGFSVTGSEG